MEVLKDVVYSILSNRLKIINSYKITNRSRMKEIIYAIQHKHPEVQFNRDMNDLIHEWVAHNRMYKWNIKPDKTMDVDLEYKETWLMKMIYRIIGI